MEGRTKLSQSERSHAMGNSCDGLTCSERTPPDRGYRIFNGRVPRTIPCRGDQLANFRSDGILLHPGPVIRGIEFSAFVLNDKRCKVLDQVTNGVFVRASLMSLMLGLEVQQA
ncbi:MAG: hypothetical protein HC883_05155 [Bdellovibrionaceae bacterium]|nr:hypothetical protein [Pseudobdellovibrionaceae bacterium]